MYASALREWMRVFIHVCFVCFYLPWPQVSVLLRHSHSQVAMHFCGLLTDLAQQMCIKFNASYVMSPCCYGKVGTHICEFVICVCVDECGVGVVWVWVWVWVCGYGCVGV